MLQEVYFIFYYGNKFLKDYFINLFFHGIIKLGDYMKNKGYSLVELLAVIIILGLIITISIPIINSSLLKSKEKSLNTQKKAIITAGRKYATEHTNVLPDETNNISTISIELLKSEGFIDKDKIINPVTEEEMNGCVLIMYGIDNEEYHYEYNDSCQIDEYLYQGVEYIATAGTQYINTGYKAKPTTKIDLDIQLTENYYTNTDNTNSNIIGSDVTTSNDDFSVNFGETGSQYNQLYFWADKSSPSGSDTYNKTYTTVLNRSHLIMGQGKGTFQDETITLPTKTGNNTGTMLLLAYYNKNDSSIHTFNRYYTKIYSFKIYEGNNIVKDFVPCYRRADNVVGLYDQISKQFYENAGTGVFTKGNNTSSLYK